MLGVVFTAGSCVLVYVTGVPEYFTFAFPVFDGSPLAAFNALLLAVQVLVLEGFAIAGFRGLTAGAFIECCVVTNLDSTFVDLIGKLVTLLLSCGGGQYGDTGVPGNFSFKIKFPGCKFIFPSRNLVTSF